LGHLMRLTVLEIEMMSEMVNQSICDAFIEGIHFCLRARDFISEAEGGLDLDDLVMDHLPLLRWVVCTLSREEQMRAKLREAVNNAAKVHPNHLTVLLN
jgi:hypothetical protein